MAAARTDYGPSAVLIFNLKFLKFTSDLIHMNAATTEIINFNIDNADEHFREQFLNPHCPPPSYQICTSFLTIFRYFLKRDT